MSAQQIQTTRHLQRLLPRFRKLRIGVLGDVMLDRYVWGEATRLSPEAAVPVVNYVSQQDLPGGAGNVAANLAALNARVELFGVIGGQAEGLGGNKGKKALPDEAGTSLRLRFRESGIGDVGVIAEGGRITTTKTRVIARHQHIVRIDRELPEPISPVTEERVFRLLLAALKRMDGLILSDYHKGLLSDAFVTRALSVAERFRVPVFVKPKSRHPQPLLYKGARLLVCNTKEASSYLGRPLPTDNSVEEACDSLLKFFGGSAVVITRGPQGMMIFDDGFKRPLDIPATNFEVTYERIGQPGIEQGANGRQVFDVTGAGDTVLSVLALAIAAGSSLLEAAKLANTAAGVVVGKLGTATVSPKELTARLHEIDD